MKTPVFCAAAVLALSLAAPSIRAHVFVPDSESDKQKEREEAKIEKEQDLYEEANDAYDDHEWSRAAKQFAKVAAMRMSHADAALFYLAKSLNNMGMRSEALSTILELRNQYPKSKWSDDSKALELEVRQSAGQKIEPERVDDEELKLIALNGLMQSDPERAVPVLDHILQSSNSPKLKDKALFVLSQSSSPQAYDILSRVAKNGGNPELQRRAVRYLGIMGGERNRRLLAELYASTPDIDTKKSVLKSYMVAGDKAHLLALAKGEQNPDLRAEAVSQLGLLGARDELAELYATESTFEVRKKIIQAMFIGGNSDKLFDIAKNEPNIDLKLTAIKNLGLLGGERTGRMLVGIYETDQRMDVRKTVVNALFIQGNATALVDLARKEKDPELKKAIISKLSLINSKIAADYLMEYLMD